MGVVLYLPIETMIFAVLPGIEPGSIRINSAVLTPCLLEHSKDHVGAPWVNRTPASSVRKTQTTTILTGHGNLGCLTGLEPATTGITIPGSTN